MKTESGPIICSGCGKRSEKPKLPKGWKRTDVVYCDKCWRERYVLHAITIPVVRPLGAGWDEFRVALREAWGVSTACSNWMMSKLFAGDDQRGRDQEKLAKMPRAYLYPEARARFPGLPSTTVSSMEQAIQGKYRKIRYKLIWTGEISLPSMRYPQPFVAYNRSWKPSYEPAGKEGGDLVPCVSVALTGTDRWLLQLQGGKEWHRQLRAFRQFVDGSAVQGELAILERRVGDSGTAHGNGTSGRDKGGQRSRSRVMLKMVGWFPRKESRQGEGSILLHRASDSLLVACKENGDGEAIIRQWNWDHIRRWAVEHRRRLQRWSDDQKAEERPVASFDSRRDAACTKYHNRMTSAQNELAHQIAELCRRQGVATVEYDDTDHGYLGEASWTWSAFETALSIKLDEMGMEFVRRAAP